MERFKRILVVVDPADEEHKAINRSLHIARLTQAKISLLLSIFDFSYEMTTMLSRDERDTMRTNLIADRRAWIADLLEGFDTDGLDIDITVVWHNRPFEAIIEHVQKLEADLLVKATQVQPSFQNLLFTPTDWHLLRKAPCPVLLVKEHAWPQHGQVLAAIHSGSEEHEHQQLNDRVVDTAQAMTEVLNASLHLVNAYPAAPINVAVEIPEFDVTQYSDELEKHHKNAMANFARKYRIPNAQQHVEQGLPEQVIPDLAKRLDAELVVLGTKGRTGFSAALLGNTAEHVLERLNCDVLAIKPADFKSPVA